MSQTPWGAPPPPRRGGSWSAPQQWQAQQWQAPAPQRPQRPGSGLANVGRVALAVVAIIMLASFVRGLLDGASGGEGPLGQARTDVLAPQVPGDPTSAYQNEDYAPPPADRNPPPVPAPRNLGAAERLVRDNPLYAQQIPTPTKCQMAALDVVSASAARKQEHFNELMGCLMTVFADPVEASGFAMPRPAVVVYDRPIKTACGDFSDVNAAYCSGDQRVYYADSLLEAFPRTVSSAPYAAEMILAHEFGHAIQARTAILISEKYLEQDARTEGAALDLSRRTEVQADCLAGQFVRSVARSQDLGAGDLERLARLAYNLGDDVLSGRPGFSEGHGTGAARQDWFTRGVGTDAVGVCNSFVAGSDEVR